MYKRYAYVYMNGCVCVSVYSRANCLFIYLPYKYFDWAGWMMVKCLKFLCKNPACCRTKLKYFAVIVTHIPSKRSSAHVNARKLIEADVYGEKNGRKKDR